MMTSETTNDNGVTSEITTPVTNNQVEVEEEGGSSLLALVGEWPDPGMLLERGSSGMLSRQLFPGQSDALVVHALDTCLLC